jgi:hypothetical protein
MTLHPEPALLAATFLPMLLVGTISHARKLWTTRRRPSSFANKPAIIPDHTMARPVDHHRFRLAFSRSQRRIYHRNVIVAVEPP